MCSCALVFISVFCPLIAPWICQLALARFIPEFALQTDLIAIDTCLARPTLCSCNSESYCMLNG